MHESLRAFLCARCRVLVRLCTSCDRGQRYCGPVCSSASRGESKSANAKRYQSSEIGRSSNARRQKRWRSRRAVGQQKPTVTHQGSESRLVSAQPDPPPQPFQEDVHVESFLLSAQLWRSRIAPLSASQPHLYSCSGCGRRCSSFERSGFLRRKPRPRRRF